LFGSDRSASFSSSVKIDSLGSSVVVVVVAVIHHGRKCSTSCTLSSFIKSAL